jgi:hypothetical protein
MKRTVLFLASFIAFFNVAMAQSPNDNNPAHVNYYKTPAMVKTDDVNIEFSDPVAKMEYVKLKVKITNNTADYIIFKPAECSFVYGKDEFMATKNPSNILKRDLIIIKPYKSASRVIDAKGSNNYHKDTFTLKIAGLTKASADKEAQTAPDFKLPPSSNNFDAGKFKCTMKNIKKETQKTEVSFTSTYNGDRLGIIDPSRVVVKLESGQEFANTESDAKPVILEKGETDEFSVTFKIQAKIADMQFANMLIVWKNAFVESVTKNVTVSPVNFEVDPGLTSGKNK